ncbi:MAG TPA: glycoside hydrolase/phage tail family protein [Hyphomicrobiaceae bacterium]|nr:glycoside hydrolase/phage tail family protein [Hyphomicrobiaceae bacterium]
MATLALAVAGAAVGGALLPAGLTLFGATLTGAAIGSQVGALAGSFIDQALLAASGQRAQSGPRLSDLRITASSEGAPIPRLYGRARLGGQIIWATNLEEEMVRRGSGGGGKGGIGIGAAEGIEYRYFANFAVALAEGPISALGRVWADGKELDLTAVTWRLYKGSEDQLPDSLIEAKEGAGNAPAYRGLAYVVFERLPLADFGNRIPQLSFEISRAVDDFERLPRAVCLIPGAGEFVYATEPVSRSLTAAASASENVHTLQGACDWQVALDQLQAALPSCATVSLVVGWFGTDLRAGECRIQPGVDLADKSTSPLAWQVAGLSRAAAHLVSQSDGRAAYGGTPADATVIAAIADLRARGLAVVLAPFIFMDVPAGNALPDPYTGAASQPPYPWRGRVTVAPAPGQPGSPDKTAAAAAQVSAFLGTAQASDFTVSSAGVGYSGPEEWSYRRFILHYAHLAVAAGGVDAFLIGSEMRGLTQVRDSASTYPFVAALADLAADVKAVLGPSTKVTYAADWSEYFGHQPADGSGDVHFHLDPLWASPDIDAVGIDVYWPLADWRDGSTHADAQAGVLSVYDPAYLRANIVGGEGYDWYYASEADRDGQVRTPITDGAYAKPWVFRFKDIRSWWLEQHFDRPGGVELPTPTAWVPQSKPIWFTELGCPAIDKGANEPNVFIDPKSSESRLPHYSSGARDDYIQRAYLQAFLTGLDPDHPDYIAGSNPVSSVYSGRMVDLAHIHLYAWDARPYPAFPADGEAWSDAEHWRLGHWITGRHAGAPLGPAVSAILDDYGFAAYDASRLHGMFAGFVIDRVLSAHEALQPLELAFFIDARESEGRIVFAHRGEQPPVIGLTADGLVESRPADALATLTRAQETDLPVSAKLTYIAAAGDYASAVEEARRLAGSSGRTAVADLPLVLEPEEAARMAEVWLFEAWAGRERAAFALPPSRLAIEPGDAVTLTLGGRSRTLRITGIGEHGSREVEALGLDRDIYSGAVQTTRRRGGGSPAVIAGRPLVLFLDLPLIRGDEPPYAGYVAAAQQPWPGRIAFYRSPESANFLLEAVAVAPAVTGLTLDALPAAPTSRFDRAGRFRVRLDLGSLASVTELALFSGANIAALENPAGGWEVLQFQSAVLVGPSTYELSVLLRGQAGSEAAMGAPLAAGARFVLIDAAVTPVDLAPDEIGLAYTWRCGPPSRSFDSPSFVEASHAFRGCGLLPLSPAHVRGVRSAGGDLVVTWVRRTRIGGDSWDTVDVPLGEESERYEVDILDGTNVKRTLSATSPTVTYTAADQTADFGSLQSAVSLRVCQLSAVAGRGTPRQATL